MTPMSVESDEERLVTKQEVDMKISLASVNEECNNKIHTI